MGKPRLLDLFCGAGGCARGYTEAGFEVHGVDHRPQPRYLASGAVSFLQADALEYLREHGREYDVIHASPPCQAHVRGLAAVNRRRGRNPTYPDLIPQTRQVLEDVGKPFVIENVEGSTLRPYVVRLCGTSFGLPIRRHRLFESNLFMLAPACAHSRFKEPRYYTSFRPHKIGQLSTVVQVYGRPGRGAMREWPSALGIDWMTYPELSQAIPPVYTLHLGRQLMRGLFDT